MINKQVVILYEIVIGGFAMICQFADLMMYYKIENKLKIILIAMIIIPIIILFLGIVVGWWCELMCCIFGDIDATYFIITMLVGKFYNGLCVYAKSMRGVGKDYYYGRKVFNANKIKKINFIFNPLSGFYLSILFLINYFGFQLFENTEINYSIYLSTTLLGFFIGIIIALSLSDHFGIINTLAIPLTGFYIAFIGIKGIDLLRIIV